jgi:hypothetical protein
MDRKQRLTAEEVRLTLLLVGTAIVLVICG